MAYRAQALSLELFYGAESRHSLKSLPRFNVIINAAYASILKPGTKYHTICLDRPGHPASACIFADDQLSNILYTQIVGQNTIRFDVIIPQRSYDEALFILGLGQEKSHEIS